jgi:protein TonB
MSAAAVTESPWQRLPWTLPAAALLTALALGGFAELLSLGRAPQQTEPPLTIQAQLVTLPGPSVPAPAAIAQPEPPPPLPPPPIPEMRMPPIPEVAPPPPPPPVVHRQPPPRPRPQPQPQPQAQPQTETPAPVAPAPSVATAPAADAARNLAGGQMGARAIYRPLPDFPSELKRQRIEAVAVARFHVAADGSAEVEMVQATDNVTLNRLLMTTFKTWRFFPALENGRPVASTIEIRVPISIH